jgi:hypothetical protein
MHACMHSIIILLLQNQNQKHKNTRLVLATTYVHIQLDHVQ